MATSTLRLRQNNIAAMVLVVVMAALLLLSVQAEIISSEQVVGSTDPVILTTSVDTVVTENSTDVAVTPEKTGVDNSTTDSFSTVVDVDQDGSSASQLAEEHEFEAFAAQFAGAEELPDGELPAAGEEFPGGQDAGAVDAAESYDANSPPGAPPGFDVLEDDNGADSSSNASDVSGVSFAGSGSCQQTGNMIDDCWRCDPNWASHRQSLANCAAGFGKCTQGGRNGRIYVVTSNSDDPANPTPGTLRYGATRDEPLWIIFQFSMTIKLSLELMVTSFKTIDGRGATVRITGGAGITLQFVSNVIIHGLYIHDLHRTGPGLVMSSAHHVGDRGVSDGDAVSVFTSKCIWIDHNYFARTQDGLVDVIRGSNYVTISNNYFTQHDKVMLLGAHKNDYMDKDMQVTVMYNRFGPGLIQRMPRVRFGNCHVVNNDYTSGWGMYAIGGSEAPVLNCEGNLFHPGNGPKGVAKKVWDGGGMYGGADTWPWTESGNQFLSGAYFKTSGPRAGANVYAKATSCTARPAYMVERMTRDSGPLNCVPGNRCS